MNPLSMFWEKDTPGGDLHWSMTRIVAFMFAVSMNLGIGWMAKGGHLHDIGWPFCALGVATLVAVPLQALAKTVQTWAMSPPGKKIVELVMHEMVTKLQGAQLGSSSAPASGEVTVKTEMTTGGNAASTDQPSGDGGRL